MGAGAMGPAMARAAGHLPAGGGAGSGGAAGAAGVAGRKGALKGAAGAGLGRRGVGERAGPSSTSEASGAVACAAVPARAKSVRWNLPEGNPGGSGDGRGALLARARVRAMKRAAKVNRRWLLPPEASGAAPEHGTEAGPGESSVLNKIFSAPGSACLEVKGKNSLGYIVNKAFMSKNRKMERQIEKLLRENAQLKRS